MASKMNTLVACFALLIVMCSGLVPADVKYLYSIGTPFSGVAFMNPVDVAVNSAGHIVFFDLSANTVIVVDPDDATTEVAMFGGTGFGTATPTVFANAETLTVDDADNIIVGDNARIQIFQPDGTFIRQFSTIQNDENYANPDVTTKSVSYWPTSSAVSTNPIVAIVDLRRSGAESYLEIYDYTSNIVVPANGVPLVRLSNSDLSIDVFICAKFDNNGDILLLSPAGDIIYKYALQATSPYVNAVTTHAIPAWDEPIQFFIDRSNNNLYYVVYDAIVEFEYNSGSDTYTETNRWGEYMPSPRNVAKLPNGYFVAASQGDSKLRIYGDKTTAEPVQIIAGTPTGDGQLAGPRGVCIHEPSGTVAVVDTSNNRIQYFTASGAFIGKFEDGGILSSTSCFFSTDGTDDYINIVTPIYNAVYVYRFVIQNNIVTNNDYVAGITISSMANSVAICGSYAFVTSAEAGNAKVTSYNYDLVTPNTDEVNTFTVVDNPYGVVCHEQNIYVVDANAVIVVLEEASGIISEADRIPVSADNAQSIAVDSKYIYIVENAGASQLKIYDIDTKALLVSYGTYGAAPGQFRNPTAMELYQNYIFVMQFGNSRVDVFCTKLIPTITTTSVVAFVGLPFEQEILSVVGGIVYYNITITGSLPAGISGKMSSTTLPNDGISLVGNATATGSFTFQVSIADAHECQSDPVDVTLTIFDAPGLITAYTPHDISTEGDEEITLEGVFPNADLMVVMTDLVVVAYIGDTPCANLVFVTGTSATCTAPAGYGDRNVITLNYQSASFSFNRNVTYNYFAYAAPTITTIDNDGLLFTTGGTAITLHGTNFGATGTPLEIRVAGLLCASPEHVTEHEVVTCVAPIGAGDKSSINITVGDNHYGSSSVSSKVVYNAVTFDCSELDVSGGPSTNGGTLLSICGANFGPEGLEQPSANGTWASTRAVMVKRYYCDITYATDTLIVCKLPPGTGTFNSVKINFNHVAWIKTGINVRYPPPQLTQVKPAEGVVSGQIITVYGYNFGYLVPEAPRHVTIGSDAKCVDLVLYGNDMLTCVVQGGRGSNQPVNLEVDGQTHSNTYTIDYLQRATPNLQCVPPAGAQDLTNPTICNCFSGYQPLDGTQCVPPQERTRSLDTCPGKVLQLNKAAQYPPRRPLVRFQNDRVYIEQRSPVAHGRRDSYLYFLSPNTTYDPNPRNRRSASTCEFPGILWTKTTDSLDCEDVWRGQIPWTQHDMCGWDLVSLPTSTLIEYATELVHQYRDVIKAPGVYHQSTHKTAYLLKVSFRRELQVVSGIFNVVFPDVESAPIDVVVTSALLYDPALQHIVFTFRTTLGYPYMIDIANTLHGRYVPATAPGNATLYAVNSVAGDALCVVGPHDPCEQEWHAILEVGAGTCLLNGQLVFNTSTLLCRDLDGPTTCPQNGFYQTAFTLTADHIRVCDSTELDATKDTTIALNSYADAALTTPANNFQVNDFVYFRAVVNAPDASIDQLVLSSVVIGPHDQNEVVYDGTAILVDADFTFTNVTRLNTNPWPVAPGQNAVIVFAFRVTRAGLTSVSGIGSGANAYVDLQIEATVDIIYHGNKKRSLVINSEADARLKDTTHVRISPSYEDEIEAVAEGVPVQDDAFVSLFASDATQRTNNAVIVFVAALLSVVLVVL